MSFSLAATRRMQVDDEEDVAAAAYASITAQLQQFTSPKLGTLPPRRYEDEDEDDMMMASIDQDDDDDNLDSVEWMQRDLQQHLTPVKTPRRTPLLERADTPIMSNSSSKRGESPEGIRSPDEHAKASTFQVIPRPKIYSPRVTPLAATITTSANPSLSPFVFRRYHETLLAYLKGKRSLSHSLDLERQGRALEAMTLEVTSPVASSLSNREKRTEVDFLSQLQQLSWSTPSETTHLEGDCWLLLVTLRHLGLSALVWDNDAVSASQNAAAQLGFLQQLASMVDTTPAEILQRLASDQSPLVLQRRYSLLQWIQTCLDQVRIEPKALSKFQQNSPVFPDEEPSLVPEAALQNLLEASLSFILAGRLEDAKALVRARGQAWRAASWGGGSAVGYDKQPNDATKSMDVQTTGNPHRFLWKRQLWKNGRRAALSPHQQVEAAISSVLANDFQTCLASPSLRSWSQAVGATFISLWGRLEDELLHLHNNQRRSVNTSLPYPGTQHEKQENEQLIATSQLANLSESQALELLMNSPFPEIRGQGAYEWAMSSFLVGKSAILDYCRFQTESIVSSNGTGSDEHLTILRFLTHLTLFLDSLQVSTTPIVLPGVTDLKNQVLFEYLQYLETRPELWHLTTLYVSLLPEERTLEWYPRMLAKVLDDSERRSMLDSMQSLLPHLVMPVLERTVRICLADEDASDKTKCMSLRWLLMEEDHAGEALVCSNILLREFFFYEDDDKMDVATLFVEEYLPDDLVELASDKVSSARIEYLAFVSYLEAYRTFGNWKDVLSETPTAISDSLGAVDIQKLNATEQEIATQRRARDWTRQKKMHCETLLEAADQARSVLMRVLTHPGGWLSIDEDESKTMDEEQQQRYQDMKTIQSRYLVLAVNLYHQVCEQTASWMSRCLDNALHMTREQALKSLQDPGYQPAVWYQYALDLAIVIADDRHGIHQALGPNNLKEILAKLAETAVSKLMSTT